VALEDLFGGGRSLQGRLLAGVVVVLIGLIGLAAFLAWRQYDDGKQQAVRETKARAILAATVFNTYFAGQVATLESMAATPTVRQADGAATSAYLRRVERGGGKLFTGGLAWIDRSGVPRATSSGKPPPALSVTNRSYFKVVMTTGRPFISEALITKVLKRRVIVMAVPTSDPRGRPNGVLTGALWLRPSATNQRAVDLGYAGLEVIDRNGQQLTLTSLAKPRDAALVARLRRSKEGVLTGAHGLDGSEGRVVAYATSPLPGWITVIDQPESAVFAAPRHSLFLEVGSISGAGALIIAVLAWAIRRSRRQLRAKRGHIRRWASFVRSLEDATNVEAVCDLLAAALRSEVPTALAVAVAARAEPHGQLALRSLGADQRVRVDAAAALQLLEVVQAAPEPVFLANADLEVAVPALAEHNNRCAFYGTVLGERLVDLGALGLLVPESSSIDDDQRVAVQALADQATLALHRVLRHEHEHTTAITLQRSLLPPHLSTVEGLAVAARYQAGGGEIEVGGDWYDLIRRPDGLVHLTVGDVAGRGIAAAVLMARLRNAFAAYALEYRSPATVIDRLARHVDQEQMVTMCCVTFDPYTRALVYASAGHPPPLLIDRQSRSVQHLDGARRTPLGWESREPLQEQRLDAPAGSVLVLYTDGIVERRDRHIDEGIDALARSVLERPADGVAHKADSVLRDLVGEGADDDVALLIAAVTDVPARVEIELPGEPALLAPLRRRLRRWFELRSLDLDADDVLLALSEACNNAIEHGYRDTRGRIRVVVQHEADEIQVTVEDEGGWREPEPDPLRGRGLLMMDALMDTVELTRTPDGTTLRMHRRVGRPHRDRPVGEPAGAAT
jgi:serine phosphatase RsbU (regulator of sigma subunit)/anti-sigma regulatory factor (Ser/Thr protein kinase)